MATYHSGGPLSWSESYPMVTPAMLRRWERRKDFLERRIETNREQLAEIKALIDAADAAVDERLATDIAWLRASVR